MTVGGGLSSSRDTAGPGRTRRDLRPQHAANVLLFITLLRAPSFTTVHSAVYCGGGAGQAPAQVAAQGALCFDHRCGVVLCFLYGRLRPARGVGRRPVSSDQGGGGAVPAVLPPPDVCQLRAFAFSSRVQAARGVYPFFRCRSVKRPPRGDRAHPLARAGLVRSRPAAAARRYRVARPGGRGGVPPPTSTPPPSPARPHPPSTPRCGPLCRLPRRGRDAHRAGATRPWRRSRRRGRRARPHRRPPCMRVGPHSLPRPLPVVVPAPLVDPLPSAAVSRHCPSPLLAPRV